MSGRGPGPVDPGLQLQRTLLSWERTGLALVVAALGVGRHVAGAAGWIVLVPCGLVVLGVLWLVLDTRRLRRGAREASPGFLVLRDGRGMAVVAAALGLLCLTEFAAALGGGR
ncbi:MAG: DUF202 domain-containing protein [Mobilicoccus sp.]|nr:DUF202 domain-containing protein [Mobilicoccus sp.]